MIRNTGTTLAAMAILLGWSVLAARAQDHGHSHVAQTATPAPAAAEPGAPQPRNEAPKGAEVYFHYPIDGIRVPQRFTARLGLRGMGIAPAGVVKPLTGHHHLLIDVENVDLNKPIPSDYNHIHLGNGQTEVVLTLTPGTHTLQLLVGDHLHIPHVTPVMSRKITVYVR
jgi:hypothetical protein